MALRHKMYGVWCLVVLAAILSPSADGAAVISIDLGSEWLKVGIVSPGVPMEIVLNKESKRKTPAVVAFRDGVRTFGEDAVNVGVRFPKNSYKYLLDLLGKSYDHPLVLAYKQRFPYYEIVESARGTPEFVHDENTRFTPEELVAQFLAKAKDFAEINHGQQISECVITVPGYFNQAERRAMKEAAGLAGLTVLQLINDYTAIGINYGIFRRKEINDTPWQALFFDMGAGSTKAALVEYKNVKVKDRGYVETVPQLQVLGVAYDRTLGGFEITLRLREHLIRAWEAQGGGDVRASPRAMEKLLREAERLKIVLSANTEHYAQIESLLDDKDFKHLVSRAELDSLCADLWPRVSSVLTRAAAAGGASAAARLVLAGGAARVPAVLALLAHQGYEPSRSINADEAAAMGAVYRAASLATGYKVAPLNVKDAVLLPVQVVFTRHVDGADKLIKRTLFSPMNPYPQKKVITFNKHTDDFSFHVKYAELEHIPAAELANLGALNLTLVTLRGVGAALRKHAGDHVDHKGIKAHFNMDDSGILNLVNVEFVAEKTVTEEDKDSTLSKLGSTISKLFGSDEAEKPEEKKEEDKAPEAEKNETANANETGDKQNATEPEAKPKPKIVVLKEPIKTDEQVLVLQPLTQEQFKTSKAKISELDAIDRKRAERESALNSLEAFVVDAQMKIDMEEFAECGTPEQIEEVKKLCSETSEWLYEDGYEAPTELYEEKLALIKEKTNPIFYKHWEHRERPDAIAALRNMLNSSNEFLKSAKNFTQEVNPEKDMFTQVEITVLEKKIEETQAWLDKSIKEQNELKKNEEIKLTIDSIREKMGGLDREVKYLVNKMKIWRPKKPIKKENKTEETIEVPEGQEKVEESVEKPVVEDNQEEEVREEVPATETPQLGDGKDEHSEL
ncbi:hypoxia up-regulated protein 1 isoform X2 [Leguminivora glycinivorella]|uniref:hypoxia up-regulated protein 1 isoform X2 n=1 Tax=Leguminivora glycinivorella TaxID=1035111 RepID=UPI00200EF167|nr:hypoxia up-regulated protein 1 isoform X2 [Leguminivora glycinivorella]